MNHETEISFSFSFSFFFLVYKYESIFLVFLYLLRFSQQLFLAGSRFSFQTPCCGGDCFLLSWLFIICSDVKEKMYYREAFSIFIFFVFKHEHYFFSWNYVVVSNCECYFILFFRENACWNTFFMLLSKMCSQKSVICSSSSSIFYKSHSNKILKLKLKNSRRGKNLCHLQWRHTFWKEIKPSLFYLSFHFIVWIIKLGNIVVQPWIKKMFSHALCRHY